MNINFNSTKIMCYGDSNTWGYIPITGQRYSQKIRWTGLLQNSLGNEFEIIEEGLNSRTTNVDDPLYEGKNGKTYLISCLETNNPIDIIILFLGTNDLKERFNRAPQQIFYGIEELIKIIQKYDGNIKIILVCPTLVDESVGETEKNYKGAEEKSKQLPSGYKNIAQKHDLSFVNLQELVQPSKKDGFHLDPEAHKALAKELEKIIKKI